MRLGLDRFDEELIDLDDIDTELEDIGQAAVSSADIIQGDLAAERLQGGNDAAGRAEAFELVTLGHLQHDLREPDRRALENYTDIIENCRILEMQGRDVEAEVHLRPRLECRTDFFAGLPHQRAGQGENEPA